MKAFISYSTADKDIAGNISELLQKYWIDSLLAHENINVSEAWMNRILEEIKIADLFISLWSENYIGSWWCIQEAGIASFLRLSITEIPIMLDSTCPEGFSYVIQAARLDLNNMIIDPFLPGIVKCDLQFGIDRTLSSKSYLEAENNFRLIHKHLFDEKNRNFAISFLQDVSKNNQIYKAGVCIRGCAQIPRC